MIYNQEEDGYLNLKYIKLVYKLMNRFNKKMPYNNNFQPLYDAGIHVMFDPYLSIEKSNDTYLLIRQSNKTPRLFVPPLVSNGDLPSTEDVLIGLINIRDKIKNGNYSGNIVKIDSFHKLCIKKYYSDIPGTKYQASNTDYVFDINEQINLHGQKFKKIRNNINKFKLDNEFYITNINPKKHIDEIISLNNTTITDWNWDPQVVKSTILNFNKLKKIIKELDGFVIIDRDENVIGFDIHYKVKHTPTMIGFMKRSKHKYRGLSNFIEQQTAIRMKTLFPNLKFINNASNKSGIKGEFKKGMRPIRFERGLALLLDEKILSNKR